MRGQERNLVNVFDKINGEVSDPGLETIQMLTDKHFPNATEVPHLTYSVENSRPMSEVKLMYQKWINDILIRKALAGFDTKKSPGPDDLKPVIFEYLTPIYIDYLNLIYKSCIFLHYTPRLWKETKVIFIPKPGKESYRDPKAFRPISLSNYFLKGLERLAVWKTEKSLKDFPIHQKQHGFQAGRSTETAISNTVNYIESFLFKKQYALGVFLDISSAFDSICPEHIRQSLYDHGGDGDLVEWYYNYIKHRNLNVALQGATLRIANGMGFPQGGVCSAKFWLIAFDPAIRIINGDKVEGNGYADDCSVVAGGTRVDHLISRLDKVLRELVAWGETCNLKFNPSKTVAVLFTRKTREQTRFIKFEGKVLPYSPDVRYLGIILDLSLIHI